MSTNRFFLNIRDDDDVGKAVSNFLAINKSRSGYITKLIAAVLGPKGIEFFKTCDDPHKSELYKEMLLLELEKNEGDVPFLQALHALRGDYKEETSKDASSDDNAEIVEDAENVPDNAMNEQEEAVSEEEKENAMNVLSFFDDGQ